MPTPTVTVTLTQAQFNWLMVRVNQLAQDESTANVAWSGDISNNPTFQQGDLPVAQGVLAALQNAVS